MPDRQHDSGDTASTASDTPVSRALAEAMDAFTRAWYAGERPDVEEFLRRYPDCGSALREKIEDFLYVAERLSRVDLAPDGVDQSHEGGGSGLQAGTVLGDFEIVREIGRGGMGVVYEAEQKSLDRRVALKILPSHLSLSEDSVKKFHREAQAGGRQSHPGIVAVHSVGSFDGIHFIAYELVRGSRSLASRLDEERARPAPPLGYFREAAAFIADVADALQHAHHSGVIHRDVKPSNILIDPEGQPKVTDFGLAKIEDALALSRTGDFSGTPYYMSPEQAGRGRAGIDHRTDISSLGVTLYEMITLVLPFEGESARDVLKKIMLDDPHDPRRINPRVPRDLSVICLKALEKKPDHRYASMAAFATDLRRFANGEMIEARPVGAAVRLIKRMRRYPAVSAALGLAAAAVLALITIGVVSICKVIQAREEADGRELLAWSQAELERDPTLSILLSIKGDELAPGHMSNNAALEALRRCYEHRVIDAEGVLDGAFGPEEKRLALAFRDGTAMIITIDDPDDILVLRGHEGPVGSIAFNRDGSLVITASEDGTARIWDTATGTEAAPMVVHEWPVLSAAFSRDGRLLVTTSRDMTALVRDVAGENPPVRLFGHAFWVTSAAFNDDGTLIVTASEDKTARIWNVDTGDEVACFSGHGNIVNAAEFCPESDRQLILTGCEDGFARLWSLSDPCSPLALFKHDSPVRDAACSPGGRTIACACADGCVYLWNVDEGKAFMKMGVVEGGVDVPVIDRAERIMDLAASVEPIELRGHRGELNSLDFGLSGEFFVTTSADGTARIWSMSPHVPGLSGEEEWMTRALGPCGGKLVQYCNSPCSLRVFDITAGEMIDLPRTKFDANLSSNISLKEFRSTDQHQIIILPPGTRRYKLKDLASDTIYEEDNTDECEFKLFAFSMDETLLAASTRKNCIKIWDLAEKRLILLAEHGGDLSQLLFTPDGRCLAVVMSDNTVRLLNVASQSEEAILRDDAIDPRNTIERIAFSPANSFLAAGYKDGTVCLWRLEGKPEPLQLQGLSGAITALGFSPNGLYIAGASNLGHTRVWNSTDGAMQAELQGAEDRINSVCFGPDSRIVAIAFADGSAMTWDTVAKSEPVIFRGHTKSVNLACLSRDGLKILTVSDDKTARLWNAATGDLESTFVHEDAVKFGAFRADGLTVSTASVRGSAFYWPLNPIEVARQNQPRRMTAHERRFYLGEADESAAVPLDTRDRSGKMMASPIEIEAPEKETDAGQPNACAESHYSDQSLPIERIDPFFFIAKIKGTDSRGSLRALMSFTPSNSGRIRLLHDFGERFVCLPASGPDGKRLCLIEKTRTGQYPIMMEIISPDSVTDPVPLCNRSFRSAFDPVWHPDGHCIYFCTAHETPGEGGHSIYRIDPDPKAGKEPVLILGRPNQTFTNPGISPDGSLMCYKHFPGHSDAFNLEVWTVSLDKEGDFAWRPRRRTFDDDDRAECWAGFMPNGESLLRFSNRRNEPGKIEIINLVDAESEIVFDAQLLKERGIDCRIMSIAVSQSGLIAMSIEFDKYRSVIRIIDPESGKSRAFTAEDLPEGWEGLSWPCFMLVTK